MKPVTVETEARLGLWDLAALQPEPVRPRASLLGAALWYAGRGLAVFPLQPGTKVPYPGSRGVLDATADPDRIRSWWTGRPQSNLGLATGRLVDVLDVDGPAGAISWARLEVTDPTAEVATGIRVLGTVSTPRPGGTHVYVPAQPGWGNRATLAPGLDYRGRGGYVVAPPSVNGDGVAYSWRRPLQ